MSFYFFENRSAHHPSLISIDKHNFVMSSFFSLGPIFFDTRYDTKFTSELFSRYWGLHQPRTCGGRAQGPEVSVSAVKDVQDDGDQADGRRLEGGLSALCGGQTEQAAQAGPRGRGTVLQVECLIKRIYYSYSTQHLTVIIFLGMTPLSWMTSTSPRPPTAPWPTCWRPSRMAAGRGRPGCSSIRISSWGTWASAWRGGGERRGCWTWSTLRPGAGSSSPSSPPAVSASLLLYFYQENLTDFSYYGWEHGNEDTDTEGCAVLRK